jgi:hypothetical protein
VVQRARLGAALGEVDRGRRAAARGRARGEQLAEPGAAPSLAAQPPAHAAALVRGDRQQVDADDRALARLGPLVAQRDREGVERIGVEPEPRERLDAVALQDELGAHRPGARRRGRGPIR